MGDLVGIGLEMIVKVLSEDGFNGVLLVVIGCFVMLKCLQVKGIMLNVELWVIEWVVEVCFVFGIIYVIDELLVQLEVLEVGKVQVQVGDLVYCCVKCVIELVLWGDVQVIVIVLLNKEVLYLVGYNYLGYIELFVILIYSCDYVMVFYIDKLKVIYVLMYIVLCKFFDMLSIVCVEMVIGIVDIFFKCVGYVKLCIVVVGVNFYVGENGLFGDEEMCILMLVIIDVCVKGMDVYGLCLLDIVFFQVYEGQYDMVVVMYYDQGYILLKLFGFYDGVNIIVGLLFIWIFVDYGIVFDIVWMGKVKFESMVVLIKLVM